MSEYINWENHEAIEVDAVLAELRQEFHNEALSPPGDDPYMRGQAYVWETELRDPSSPIYEIVSEIVSTRLKLGKNVHPISSLAIILRSAFQKQLIYGYKDVAEFQKNLPKGYGNYPFKYRDNNHQPIPLNELNYHDIALDSLYALNHMLLHERSNKAGVGVGEFIKDAAHFNVMTNRTERLPALKATMVAIYEQLQRPVTVADFGCSGNNVLKAAGIYLPQQVSDIYQYVDETYTQGEIIREERRDLTARFNAYINRKIPLGPSVGMDLWSPYDNGVNYWRKACTFRGLEWMNKEKEDEYDYLDQREVDGVDFIQADLSKGVPPELANQKYDIGYFSFFLHQLKPDERTHLLDEAKDYVRYSVILDAVKILPDGSLDFRESFYNYKNEPFPISVIVVDNEDPNAKPELIMEFTDGRCQRARIFKNRIFDRI